MQTVFLRKHLRECLLIVLASFAPVFAQGPQSSPAPDDIYKQVKAFALTGGTSEVKGLVLKRDRTTTTLTGTLYFSERTAGRVTGAVFVGKGTFSAEIPPSRFEKDNIRFLLGSDRIESDFKNAVFRFSDDTFDVIGKSVSPGPVNARAQELAAENDLRIRKESGANISARVALSIANAESPGFFFASFSGGNRGEFSFVFDPQTRIPSNFFGINGGEKGLIFAYNKGTASNDIWTAFAGLDNYKSGTVAYSDTFDLIDITAQDMEIDVRNPEKRLGVKSAISLTTRSNGIRVIPFNIGESLGESRRERLKKQMVVRSVRLGDTDLGFVQEEWDSGFLVFLPGAVPAGEKLRLEMELQGDFMRQPEGVNEAYYPRSNTTWYPRHGFLDRCTYDLRFTHDYKLKIASVGVRLSEETDKDSKVSVTHYKMDYPVALVTFAAARFERHDSEVKLEEGAAKVPMEYFSLRGNFRTIKEKFILAELNNSIRYFHDLFGDYPYGSFKATFHPYPFGQGFPSMLMLPKSDRASKFTYAFIAHETAHQWWGNIVAWRSYRDQWLSEGFAEYSGVLYTGIRDSPKAATNLIDNMRQDIKVKTRTRRGIGKTRAYEVGPIIAGIRLNSSKSLGVYQNLVYNKGALVLRMIHFLMTDPSTGNDEAFFAMMKSFVEEYRNKVASTDDFRSVAGVHFAKTPIARKYGLKDLDWFFAQWVYGRDLPTYKIEYTYQDEPNGQVVIRGVVKQENTGKNWFMPLPISFEFGKGQYARGTISALGPSSPFQIKLPMRPRKTEIDVKKWVLSKKTSASFKKSM